MARKAPASVKTVPADGLSARLFGLGRLPRGAPDFGSSIQLGEVGQERTIAQQIEHRFDGKGERLRAATARAFRRR